MCQILGMNCASPTDFRFSFRGFRRRGGDTDIHAHGWGVVAYNGKRAQAFHDIVPACQSPIAELLQNVPIQTHNMMAHIRYATQGAVELENVHPFSRVFKGVQMTFCHNGDCPPFSDPDNLPLLGSTRRDQHVMYHPLGATDSEAVFCALLNALHAKFQDEEFPSAANHKLPLLYATLNELCREIVSLAPPQDTICNFLLGCGPHTMFAYSWPGRRPGSRVWNGLHYLIREPPFCTAQLLDDDACVDFSTVTTAKDRVAVITTQPLTTNESWVEFEKGQLVLFYRGKAFDSERSFENRRSAMSLQLVESWASASFRAPRQPKPSTLSSLTSSPSSVEAI